ncbi:hypothetical protein LSTR_LSTR006036 [Laodelphax striatellus]|uniref:Direct IAP-binding protein with low pI n=1 Tax=Laodelphax striatellus TaxID=195883 RepID=A0A482XPH3_LAOST|nr:hypothetical protein LSTR_LSTR006036 [Laodelphax striatellus]
MFFSRISTILGKKNVTFFNVKRCLPLYALIVPIAHCKLPKEYDEKERKRIEHFDRPQTHEYLIHQACHASVNSASELLMQTTFALLDAGQEYRKALSHMRSLLNDSLQRTINGLAQPDDLEDMILEARSTTEELKKSVMNLQSLMKYVENLVEITAETAFIAGTEYGCNTMSDRLHSAQREITEDSRKTTDLERECLRLHAELISYSPQQTNSKEE